MSALHRGVIDLKLEKYGFRDGMIFPETNGSFFNYVDQIVPNIDHLPTHPRLIFVKEFL